MTGPATRSALRGRLGDSIGRPDGVAKVQGTFAFAGDLSADGFLWGATLRSPHPHARIVRIDTSGAWRIAGVEAVITAVDVPGKATYGLISDDQPVFAADVVRFVGEPVAAVAADHPDTCRRALAAIVVEYEVLVPLTDPERAVDGSHAPIHPDGNVVRHQRIVRGDQTIHGPVVVEGTYELGMQDQAFLGLEAALAIPDSGGDGVELFVATQWLHEDRKQIAACLGVPADKVRLTLGGVGGAFGAREDISLQVHTCLLALRTGRPVRMAYSREESFLGHVHRHPCTIWMRHHADHDGRIRRIEARFVFDGGAYASTSSAVLINGITHAQGPYKCENATVDGWAVRTNNLPCGAMRGFGVVQACFAHEGQMDKLAAAVATDPVSIRLLNAMETGDRLITGQVIENVAPVERCIRETAALPLPTEPVGGHDGDPLRLPGGSGLTADVGHVRRGIGWGVAIKNLMYSEAFDDYSTARVRLADGVASVKVATAEVGQGFVTIAGQIARRAGRRRGRARADRHRRRVRRQHLRLAADLDERWRGRRCLPAGARAPVRARRRPARCRPAAPGDRRHRRRRPRRHLAGAGRPRRPPVSRSSRPSNTTIDPRKISTNWGRATATPRSPSSLIGRWSTWMSSSGWSRWCRSPPRKTSAGR